MTTSAGSRPDGRATTRTERPFASASAIPRRDASSPAASESNARKTVEHTRFSSVTWPSVSAVPIEATAFAVPRLVQGEDVGVPLDDDRVPRRGDRAAGAVEAVEHLRLVEERAFGRVQVLRRLAAGHLAGAEAADPSADVGQREHEPPPEPVDRAAPPTAREPGLPELRRGEALGERRRADAIPRRG